MKWGHRAFSWIGLLATAGGIAFFAYHLWFCLTAAQVGGEVREVYGVRRDKVDIDRQRIGKVSRIDYDSTHISVEYLVSGELLRAEFDIGEQVIQVGDAIDLLYHPEDPTNVKMSSFRSLFLGPLALMFMGAVFYLVAQFVKLVAE